MKRKALFRIFFVFFFCFSLSLYAEEFRFKNIDTAEDLPEEFCSMWKKGDLLVTDGKFLLLFGGTSRILRSSLSLYPNTRARGNILSFVPAGKNLRSDLDIGAPRISLNKKRKYVTYDSIKIINDQKFDNSVSLEASAIYTGDRGEEAEIKTVYRFYYGKGIIDITSTIKNTGKVDIENIDYSLNFDAYSRYYFSPFHLEKHPRLMYRTYQKKGHYLGWLDMTLPGREERSVPGNLVSGQAFEAKYILLVDSCCDKLLSKVYNILEIEPKKANIHFKDFEGDVAEVIVEDLFSSSIFFRSFLDKPSFLQIPLPQGVYLVRVNFFPTVCEEFMALGNGTDSACTLQDSPKGTLNVKIHNSEGEFVPGKVSFIGLDPTKTPYFKPEDPIGSGRRWEKFKNSRYPPEEGMEVKLPIGTYLIHCSRGPEYSVDKKVIEVLEGTQYELVFHIDRMLDTKNLISIDPHLHTRNSDGRISIPERIKSIVVEGVDVAVASDHNFITDYYPTLKRLGLNPYLAVIAGNEVSLSDLIHYNTYPLTIRKDEEYNGAIDPLAVEVSPVFEKSRKKDPEAILQVNHPRLRNIGYFNSYQLDEETAIPGRDHFDLSFDVLEVMNGPCLYRSGNDIAIEDWLHLLSRGYYFPLIGSSDSHLTDKKEPGYSRTYVYYEGGEGEHLEWPAIAEAIKKGCSFTSNGPIIDFRIDNQYKPGDTLTALNGRVDVWVKVECVPWVAVDEVRIIVNGERKMVFPVKVSEATIKKFEEQISLELDRDAYIAVEAFGKKSLFPVLQEANRGYENATFPYALTNPVFVDVDGNGKYDPSLQEH